MMTPLLIGPNGAAEKMLDNMQQRLKATSSFRQFTELYLLKECKFAERVQSWKLIVRFIPLGQHEMRGLHNHMPVCPEPDADPAKVDEESDYICPVWNVPKVLGQTNCLLLRPYQHHSL